MARNMSTRAYQSSLVLAFLMFSVLAIGSSMASASAISDLPERLADTMDISEYAAGMILSIGMIMAVALVLAVAEMPPIGIVLPLLGVMILLTVVGWLDRLVPIFCAVVVAIYFGMVMKGIWTAEG